MADIRAHITALNERRARAAKQLNDHFDSVIAAGRPMNEEEKTVEAHINAEIDEIEAEIRRFVEHEKREAQNAEMRTELDSMFGAPAVDDAAADVNDQLRAWMRGESGGKDFVLGNTQEVVRLRNAMRQGASGRDLRNAIYSDTGSVGTAVQTTVAATIYEYMENSIAMFRAPTTKVVTGNGEPLRFPTVATHAIGTQVAGQGTAIAGTDPTFSGMTLGAYKYGQLVAVSSEAVEDVTFDLTGFIGRDVARGLSRLIDADLVVGGGSSEPQGIMTASWGSVATGGTLVPASYDTLIDLKYGVADEYAMSGSAGWLMSRATAGALRKLRDGAGGTVGNPLWQFSSEYGLVGGQPDRLLGDPAYTDPNVASQGSAAKAILYADFSAYYVRQVGNIAFERSDHYGFDTDTVYFRGKWRVDGDVIDTKAGLVSHQVA